MATIRGTRGDDILAGMPGSDRIFGFAGADDITGREGDDWIFGGGGSDIIRWVNGDGHDRIDSGSRDSDPDVLDILSGRNLRLHLDVLGAGPEMAATDRLQVIGIKDIELLSIDGTNRDDRLVLSSDRDLSILTHGFFISTGAGSDRIDASRVQGETWISTGGSEDQAAVVRGSAEFRDSISTGAGDDRIWTGAGGGLASSGSGDDTVHLGSGRYTVSEGFLEAHRGHDTVFNFNKGDLIEFFNSEVVFDSAEPFDTNRNGRLDAGDEAVTVHGDDMTIDLSAAINAPSGTTVVTLIDRPSISLSQLMVEFISNE